MVMVLGFRKAFLLSWVALVTVIPAQAQENLDAGKSPAQLFASDCSICHKSARGLSKSGGLFGLSSFLREHYTASRETAGALAAYLKAVDAEAPAAKQRPVRRVRASKPKEHDDKTKAEPKKTEDKKAEDKKPDDAKSAGTSSEKKDEKASEKAGSSDTKPSETKPGDDKSSEAHAASAKPAEKPAAEKKTESDSAKAAADKPAEKKE